MVGVADDQRKDPRSRDARDGEGGAGERCGLKTNEERARIRVCKMKFQSLGEAGLRNRGGQRFFCCVVLMGEPFSGLQKTAAVLVVLIDRLPPVAPIHDLVKGAGILNSQFARPGADIAREGEIVSIVLTDPWMDSRSPPTF